MAEKIIPYNGLSTGLTLYVEITRDSDGFIKDSTDGVFKAPATVGIDSANSMTERAIDGVNTQIYEYSDSTIEWDDGTYRFRIKEQAGGAAASNIDRIFASGTLILRGDKIIERSYSFGGEIDSVPVDVKTVVEDAASSIIAAQAVTVTSDYEGTATGGSNTTVVEALAMWNVNIWASTGDLENLCIVESAATGKRYGSKIVSNTNTTLTVAALAGGYTVVAGDKFYIRRNSNSVDVKSVGSTAQTGVDLGVQIPLTNTKLDTLEASLTDIETDIEATNTALGTIETDIEATNTALGTIEDDLEVLTASTPTIYNVSIAAADTEYSQALPAHTKAFAISIINGTVGENFRWAFETGKVATPTASYRQIDQEFEYSKDNLDISETIYIAASDVCVAQLEVWT